MLCGARAAPRPPLLRLQLAPRRAEKQPLLPHSSLGVSGWLAGWPARLAARRAARYSPSPLAFPRHPSLGWRESPGNGRRRAASAPPLAAFWSLPRLPLLLRGHHKGARARGGAPSIPKSLPPFLIPHRGRGGGALAERSTEAGLDSESPTHRA